MEERLQKYMARCGIASRRKCETLITEGKVKVNNSYVTELGVKVTPGIDIVEYNGKVILPEENKVYLCLNGRLVSLNIEDLKDVVDMFLKRAEKAKALASIISKD